MPIALADPFVPVPTTGQGDLALRYSHHGYTVRRKVLKLLGGAFYVYDPDGNLAFYSKQKAFKLKEDIRLFTGEDMQQEVLCIQGRQVIDFSAAYDVIDPVAGEKVGALRRKGLKSMFKDEWIILDVHDREIGLIMEGSAMLETVRRFIEFASLLLPQAYHGEVNGQQVCSFKKNFNPLVLKVALDFSSDPTRLLDRRLGIAAAVLLCAIEGRQN